MEQTAHDTLKQYPCYNEMSMGEQLAMKAASTEVAILYHKSESEKEKSLSGSDYNEAPYEFREITQMEFAQRFFHYIFKNVCSKQIFRDANGVQLKETFTNIRFWEVSYPGWEGMGVAMAHQYSEDKMRYFIFGEEKRWKKKENEFASQFAGDNS